MVVFICFRRVQQWERESGSNNTRCLSCFVLFCRASLCSLIVSSPPALCPYRLPRHRVVSSVQQFLFRFSTYVVLRAAFLILLHHITQNSRWLLFCLVVFGVMPCSSSSSSCCFARAGVMFSLSARMLSFMLPFSSSCIKFFRTTVVFLSF